MCAHCGCLLPEICGHECCGAPWYDPPPVAAQRVRLVYVGVRFNVCMLLVSIVACATVLPDAHMVLWCQSRLCFLLAPCVVCCISRIVLMVVSCLDCFVPRSFRLTLIRGWMAPDEALAERLWRVSMYGWPPSLAHYIKCAHFGTHKVLFWLMPLLQIVRFVSSVCAVASLGWCTVHAFIAAAHSSLVTSSMKWSQQSVSILLSCCQQNLSPPQVAPFSPAWTAWLQTHWFWGALFVVNLCSSLSNGICMWGVAHAGFTLIVQEPTMQYKVQLLWLCLSVQQLLHEVCVGCNIKLMRGIIMLVTTYSCVLLHTFDLLFAAHPVFRILATWLACVGGLNLVWCGVDVLVFWCLQSTRCVLQQARANVHAWFSWIATFLFTLVAKLIALCTAVKYRGRSSRRRSLVGICWTAVHMWRVVSVFKANMGQFVVDVMALLLWIAKQPLAWALRTIVAFYVVAVYMIGTFLHVSTQYSHVCSCF